MVGGARNEERRNFGVLHRVFGIGLREIDMVSIRR